MDFLRSLTGNYIINIGFLSWFAAQFIKTLLAYLPSRKVSWERMVGSGGMPSSHSSLVCSVAVGMARKTGSAAYFPGVCTCCRAGGDRDV